MRILKNNADNNNWEIISSITFTQSAPNEKYNWRIETQPLVSVGYIFNKVEAWGHFLNDFTAIPSLKNIRPGKYKALQTALLIVGITISLPFTLPLRLIGSMLRAVGTANNFRGKQLAQAEDMYSNILSHADICNSLFNRIQYRLKNEFIGMSNVTKAFIDGYLEKTVSNADEKDKWTSQFRKEWNAVVYKFIKDKFDDSNIEGLEKFFEKDPARGRSIINSIKNHFSKKQQFVGPDMPINYFLEDLFFKTSAKEFNGLVLGLAASFQNMKNAANNYNSFIARNLESVNWMFSTSSTTT